MGDLSPSVSKWHRSSFFLRKQHFFKSTKVCHLCDAPSHKTAQPYVDDPNTACPDTGKPDMDNPCLENRPQLNKDKRNTEFIKYKRIKSYPIKPRQVLIRLVRIGYGAEELSMTCFREYRVCVEADIGQHY